MNINKLIKKLAAFEPDGMPFLSLYLNAEANESGGEDYQVWLKKELSNSSAAYEENTPESEKFEQTTDKINDCLETLEDASANGIAIFASFGNQNFFEAIELDVAFPENEIFTLNRPHIFPLVMTLHQHPKYAVLWADTNKAAIYVFGGESRIRTDNEADEKVESIQNRVTNNTSVGGWSQGRYQRHIENFHFQHAKETVAELEDVMREKNIDQLVLCGDGATIMPVLRPQLSTDTDEKVIGVLNLSQYDSTEEIHTKTLEVVEAENTASDEKSVKSVFDAAKAAAGMGTLGLEETLRALANGQVQVLVITAKEEALEYNKGDVKKLLKEYAPAEDASQEETSQTVESADGMADELIIRAINSDAKLVFIEDELLLKDVGGVGSVLRYNTNATAG